MQDGNGLAGGSPPVMPLRRQVVESTSGQDDEATARVVVGVDPSAEARAALRWALRYGALITATVEVTHGWQAAREYVWFAEFPAPDDPTGPVRRAIEQMVSEARTDTGLSADRVATTVHVVEGRPAKVLLDRADGAALLVLGSRGHGGYAGFLLGSVTTQCAAHAPCPVTIVRPDPEVRHA